MTLRGQAKGAPADAPRPVTACAAAPHVLVCVHGAGGGGWEWRIWQRVAAARRLEVLAPDLLPAAGGLAATCFADYRAQVQGWCAQAAAHGPFAMVGASLGGLLALAVAAAAKPAALVLVNSMPPAGVAGMPVHAPRPAVVPWARQRSIEGTRRAMPEADAAACLYAFRHWRDESGRVLDEAAGIAVEAPACPLLVLAGGADADVPPAVAHALGERFGGRVRLIEGMGHLGPLLGRNAAAVAVDALDWMLHAHDP